MGTGGGSVGNAAWANNAVFGTTSNANVVILQNDAEKLRVNSVAGDATLKITQSSETGGQLLIRSNYSDPHFLATQGTNHSSGGWYWGYGVQMQGNGTTKSTFSNFSGSRSFVQLFGDRIQYNFAGAQNTTIGNAVSLTESVRIDAQGIKFNGDTATANALDDYEEGTWTGAIGTSDTQFTTSGQTSNCRYTKVGNMVTVYADIAIASPTNGTGVVRVTGLPFSSASAGFGMTSQLVAGRFGDVHSFNVMGYQGTNSNVVLFYYLRDDNSLAGWDASQLNGQVTPYVGFTMTYQTA